jgi:hypothetical protein
MNKMRAGTFALAALALWAVTAASQPPEGKDRKDDRPPGGPPGGPPRFELGRVLPPFAREAIELTPDQEREIARLEKEVKERLSRILTAEQRRKLQNLRPPGPGGRRGPGRGRPPEGERPERPGRPPDGERPKGNRPERPREEGGGNDGAAQGGIQWFATWESGLREARRTGRPLLLVSAAPHCAGVSGTW